MIPFANSGAVSNIVPVQLLVKLMEDIMRFARTVFLYVCVLLFCWALGYVLLHGMAFGPKSWDGNPPGTIQDLYGPGFQFGSKVFPGGTWTVTVRETHTLWQNDQLVIQPLGLLLNHSLTFTSNEPWTLDAYTKDFTNGGAKFCYKEGTVDGVVGVWIVGLEDMLKGDDDYQDAVVIVKRGQ